MEILVDDEVPFGPTRIRDGVDGEDDLFVALIAPDVGEGEGETRDDRSTTSGVHSNIWVVAVRNNFTGSLVDGSGLSREVFATGSHHRDIPITDSLPGGIT